MSATSTTSTDLDTFLAEATTFLDANASLKGAEKKFVWGEGSDKVSGMEEKDRKEELVDVAEACEFRRKRFDAGFGWITGPKEFGGQELTGAHERAYNQLEAKYQTPNMAVFTIGLGMVAPTILAHASDHAKDLYLTKLYRGDLVGCQLFSEP